MPPTLRRPFVAAPRVSGAVPTRMIPPLHALALLALLLLPVQMRAGAQHPHPHALMHLLLDASDGSFDHHTLGEAAASPTLDHAGSVDTAGSHQRDIPTVGTSVSAAGGLAVLAAVVAALRIPSLRVERIWARPTHWRDRLRAIEPPPPRNGCV